MNKILIASFLALFLTSSLALADKKKSAPEQYAAALAALLTDYQKQVAEKIAAEEQAYTAAAKFYDAAFRTNVAESLTNDRISDSLHALAGLTSKSMTPDQLIADVNTYAQNDFNQTRSLYQMNIDSYQTYLSNLFNLDIDSQQISVLLSALQDLATHANLATRLGEIQAYQKTFSQQLHLSNCSLADSLLTIRTNQKAALDAEIAALPANSPKLNTLPPQSSDLQTQINTLQTQRANSGGYTTSGTCQAQ